MWAFTLYPNLTGIQSTVNIGSNCAGKCMRGNNVHLSRRERIGSEKKKDLIFGAKEQQYMCALHSVLLSLPGFEGCPGVLSRDTHPHSFLLIGNHCLVSAWLFFPPYFSFSSTCLCVRGLGREATSNCSAKESRWAVLCKILKNSKCRAFQCRLSWIVSHYFPENWCTVHGTACNKQKGFCL